MSDVQTLIAKLAHHRIELWADGEQLRYRGPKAQLTAEVLSQIKQHKAAILSQLVEAKRYRLLVEENRTVTPYPSDKCIHHLFEEQAVRTPEAVAVIHPESTVHAEPEAIPVQSTLTYRELNARANQLAHHLQAIGVGPDVLVGLCIDRSLDMIVGMLGILKAGGAYVPLDPSHPRARLAFMLQDTATPVLITQSHVYWQLPPTPAQVVCLDDDWTEISLQSDEDLACPVQPEHLAYIIYTSGSTGQPKGVMIQHDSLVALATATQNDYALTWKDRILQFAALSFDVAVEEIFPCLISGATLVLRTADMIQAVPTFLQCCQRWGITVLNLPTLFWQLLTSELGRANRTLPDMLRLVIIGTEAAQSASVHAWWQHVGAFPALINAYGPTETTVTVTRYTLKESWLNGEHATATLPIGRPIANVQVYILDEALAPVPIGVTGDLYIGGPQVARGYLNQRELTAERFIDCHLVRDGLKLYQTGDRARYLPDGNLEFVGREDDQVKIRGFRVEMGDIESVLNEHTAVQEAIVVVRADEASAIPGDKQLVAYVIPISPMVSHEPHLDSGDAAQPSAPLQATTLRQFLLHRLPDYMVPANVVFVDHWPVTPNGKIDRDALPAPMAVEDGSDQLLIQPRNDTEKVVAEIWKTVLQRQHLDIHDNFIELGGHSLQATQIMTRLYDIFRIQLPLSRFFEHPTIAGLASLIDHNRLRASITNSGRNVMPPPCTDLAEMGEKEW